MNSLDMEYIGNRPLVQYQGMGDKPCWRIQFKTIISFWWGPYDAREALYMMARNWRDWTPDPRERDLIFNYAANGDWR